MSGSFELLRGLCYSECVNHLVCLIWGSGDWDSKILGTRQGVRIGMLANRSSRLQSYPKFDPATIDADSGLSDGMAVYRA
jgi:hypothetical protein